MAQSSLHTIMMPVRGDGKGPKLFAHASALAKRFGAHVKVVHCHPKMEDLMPMGVVIPSFLRKQLQEASETSASSEEDFLHEKFSADAVKHGVSEQDPETGKPTAKFYEYVGKQVEAVRHFGRLSDLICVAKPSKTENLGFNTLKEALFSSGRPVMICTESDATDMQIGRHVSIGWNGSLEATRAVALTMPLIETAEKVTILTGGGSEHSATATEFQEYLANRSVTADIVQFDVRGNAGRQLLKKSGEVGADLLIMGAYHESYERETLLGGNSAAVVEEATIPVVMVH
ncbi:universal stress protein [Roseivivax sediminis]|uniref:Nucleotide-binding universal stress protein, UspA family n=1 Tax=Roseivivax sediminis TaxID=936889 RepID=A0A1I2AF82_9RHOB|nr:universal stress protein [Roseivivax sediminis]SFE42674.1 Nucleotide-binding universal stress protein, UspA family [Roseivivax sediminis]